MNIETIRFSYNWNGKLNNKAFTTLRIHNPGKYTIGKTYNIELNGEFKGQAVLREKRVLQVKQLNDFICYLDTGYNQFETLNILRRMYKAIDLQTARFDFCLLVYKKEPKPKCKEIQTAMDLK